MRACCDLSAKDPEQTLLHAILREHLASFLDAPATADGIGMSAHGVARFVCSACKRDRVVALSCKGRGFCPRCLGRRMTELAFEWTRLVRPRARIRQWVLSLPFWLRVPLGYRHALALAVHAVAGRAIESWYRKRGRALGLEDARTGMLTVIQRFGSDLALNVHFHSLVPDGVFDVHGRFTPIAAPTPHERPRHHSGPSPSCAHRSRSSRPTPRCRNFLRGDRGRGA